MVDVPAGLEPAYRRISLEELRQEILSVFDSGCVLLQAACLDNERLTHSSIARLDEIVTRFAEVIAGANGQVIERAEVNLPALCYFSDSSFNFSRVSVLDVVGLIESMIVEPKIAIGSPFAIITLSPPNARVTVSTKPSLL